MFHHDPLAIDIALNKFSIAVETEYMNPVPVKFTQVAGMSPATSIRPRQLSFNN
jgi:hypothetical protein